MTGRSQSGTVATIIATALFFWVIIKASVIGYYPNEVLPQLIVPGIIGVVFFWTGKTLSRD